MTICPMCKGSTKEQRTSFVNPSKTIETSCSTCHGKGTLPGSLEDLLTEIERLRNALLDAARVLESIEDGQYPDPQQAARIAAKVARSVLGGL